MEQDRKSILFETLATNVESYAWVASTVLKEKFGTIDDEEEYKKIAEEVVDYSQSEEFKSICTNKEIGILETIVATAIEELRVLNGQA